MDSCPVCRAAFRGAARCSRCATDLSAVMQLMIRAWRQRASAARHLDRRALTAAADVARASLDLHATRYGRQLASVTALLAMATRHELDPRV